MKKGNIQILDLDFEYKLWKNRLMFYQSELELLLDRSTVLMREHETWKMNESLKNRLQEHLRGLEILQSRIITQEQEMALYAEDYPINSAHSHFSLHESIRTEVEKITTQQSEIFFETYPVLRYPLSSEKK